MLPRGGIGHRLRKNGMQTTRTAVFDLDGTLADTAPDLVAAANALLAELDLPPLALASTRNAAGMGGRALIRLGCQRAGRPEPHGDSLEDLYRRFLVLYDDRIAGQSRLFDGVARTLDGLRGEGWRLAVCTNKPVAPARRLLEHFDLLDRFGAVLGGDSLDVRKPDPRHVAESVAAVGGRPDRAAMVGDSIVDLSAAHAAGLPCALVRYGYSAKPVDELGADAVLDRFDELSELLPRWVGGP